MKKFMFLATMASVALASCTSEEKMEMTSEAQKISFDAPVFKTQTRGEVAGEIVGTTYPTGEKFAVFAVQHSGDFNGWASATSFWTNALTVTFDQSNGSNGGWDTDTDYYWPESPYKLTFAAYSPSDVTGVTCGADGLTITDYEAPTTVGSQYDLMYSNRSTNNNEANNAESGAPIVFNHALSSIVFAAVDADNTANYTITGLTLNSSSWKNKGTFKQNITETAATGDVKYTESANPSWSLTNETATITDGTIFSGSYSVTDQQGYFTGNGYTVEGAAKKETAILVIPQDVPSDATVTITYTKTPTNGPAQTGVQKTVKLSDFQKLATADNTTTESISKWNINNRYTYVFSFGKGKKIFFTATVTDWVTEGNMATVTID